MLRRNAYEPPPAEWPYRLPDSLSPDRVESIRRRVDALTNEAQYGWGHTIDFGPFTKEGVLQDNFLRIAGYFDALGWWPRSMEGLRVADIGSFTGGLSLLLAHRGAAGVVAVDEIPEHIAQCAYLCEVFGVDRVRSVEASLFSLPEEVERGSFDLVFLIGILYHLSDMLVGLLVARDLLKVGGTLLIEGSAVDDDQHSYANFGRFAMGTWWQPSTLCVRDMCEFTGLSSPETVMWHPDRCLARAQKTSDEPIPFRRGLNYQFPDLRDATPRLGDLNSMAPR
jgi:SAM-dependent methyltransferase